MLLSHTIIKKEFQSLRGINKSLNYSRKDYVNARRCINGTDKAREIANIAKKWEIKL
ncbi:hypothetical protein [Cyanobacterium aponinum]|uniref:hypothetical protein n=1 Tax=Cyanobacterium aponinum TaxID=379064 RepID=UPI0002D326E3|nr:hypothetical protein [Cyanobacterium aponinum]